MAALISNPGSVLHITEHCRKDFNNLDWAQVQNIDRPLLTLHLRFSISIESDMFVEIFDEFLIYFAIK